MSRSSWLVDGNRIATKIKSAFDPGNVKWKSNPTISCPKCKYIIDNSDVGQTWPGFPRGVKFDPTDQEIVWHLLAKVGFGGKVPHPFIEEFIPTVDNDGGICYTHPQNLPGVKQDGTASHFFHRAIKAYNTGSRKRRKIQGDNFGDVRWHKTGRTKPVILDGEKRGCKKIMVLYTSQVRGGKAEKTNWVMHQYHLGAGENEEDGQYVISKIFYQQQQATKGDKVEEELSANLDALITTKVDPVTPVSVTPDPPRTERHSSDFDLGINSAIADIEDEPLTQYAELDHLEDDEVGLNPENRNLDDHLKTESQELEHLENNEVKPDPENPNNPENEVLENDDDCVGDESTWWAGESQNLLSSQQMVDGLSFCEEFLRSQSPSRDGNGDPIPDGKSLLASQYAKLGAEDLKKDLEECQKLVSDPANIYLDTPPEFRLSQLDFGSQESYIPWGGEVK